MRVLVVHAHPSPASFNHACFDAVLSGLARSSHRVDTIDLEAEQYDPRLSRAERLAYHGDTPILDDAVRRHADLVLAAEALVFVYPTWWFGLPALLKGWLERTLVPGIGFILDEETNKVRPGLHNVRTIVGVTTYGSSRTQLRLFADGGRRVLLRTLRLVCHPRCRRRWIALYSIDTSTAQDRQRFLERIEQQMAEL